MKQTLVLFTFVAALGGLLFGFDTVIINGAIDSIVQHFGLNSVEKGFTVSSALIGCIIGSALIGVPAQKYGAKPMMMFLSVLFILSSIGCAFAPSISVFIGFRFIGGLAIGGTLICPVYISEVAPPKVRGRLASTYQLAIVIGILLSLLCNYFLKQLGDNSWRWMLLSGVLPAIVFFGLLFFIRQSPRWLVGKGRTEEAVKVIRSVSGNDENIEARIEEIKQSFRSENESKSIHVFDKRYRKIIWLGIMVAVFNQLTGIGVVFYYSSSIFHMAGFPESSAMLQSVMLGVANLLATLIAMPLLDKVGRKKLLLVGQAGIVIMLFLFAYGLYTSQIQGNYLVALLIAYILCFAFSQGATVWVLLSEMFPNKIRSKGASIGSFSNWIVSAALNFFFPVVVGLFTSQVVGLSVSFLFLSVVSLIGFIYLNKNIMETKGQKLEDIEKMVVNS